VGFESEFLDLMPDVVTLKRSTGMNISGEHTYDSGEEVQCRVVLTERIIRTVAGREIHSPITIYVGGSYSVTDTDLIEFADGQTLPILMVRRYGDEEGVHHEELLMGWRG
jgi:hypothetical protein